MQRTIPVTLPLLPQYVGVVVRPRTRDYLVDGVKYPRVTSALSIINKPALIPWAKQMALAKVEEVLLDTAVRSELVLTIEETPDNYGEFVRRVIERASKFPDKVRDDRAESGTNIHREIHEWSRNPVALAEIAPARVALRAAIRFLTSYNIEVCDSERVVWSPESGVAGTIDGVGFQNGSVVIWDWKTSAAIYWETALQLSAYAHLLTEITGVAVRSAYAVRLSRPGEPEGYECKMLDHTALSLGWTAYQSAYTLKTASKLAWWVGGEPVGEE